MMGVLDVLEHLFVIFDERPTLEELTTKAFKTVYWSSFLSRIVDQHGLNQKEIEVITRGFKLYRSIFIAVSFGIKLLLNLRRMMEIIRINGRSRDKPKDLVRVCLLEGT